MATVASRSPAPHGAKTGGEGARGRHAEQATRMGEVVGGSVETRDDPRPGGAGRIRRRRAGAHPPRRASGRRDRRRRAVARTSSTPLAISATGARSRPQPTSVPMRSSSARPTGPAAPTYTPRPATRPTPRSTSPSTSPAWPSRAAANERTRRSTRDGGGFRLPGARFVLPERGRWVVATVPPTVPVAPPATRDSGVTSPSRWRSWSTWTVQAGRSSADGSGRALAVAAPTGTDL